MMSSSSSPHLISPLRTGSSSRSLFPQSPLPGEPQPWARRDSWRALSCAIWA